MDRGVHGKRKRSLKRVIDDGMRHDLDGVTRFRWFLLFCFLQRGCLCITFGSYPQAIYHFLCYYALLNNLLSTLYSNDNDMVSIQSYSILHPNHVTSSATPLRANGASTLTSRMTDS